MNIIVITACGKIVCRPDTTWERDNEDLYLPDFVSHLEYAPVAFARICKPGRSVGSRFVSRYHDGFGFGVLLYPVELMDGSPEGYAQACCLDHTSLLPTPFMEYADGYSTFTLKASGSVLGNFSPDVRALMDAALVEATRRIYVRTGDIIAVELQPRQAFYSRTDGNVRMEGTYGESRLLDFNIIVE